MIVKSVENKEKNTVSFAVEIEAAEFEKALNSAYLKNKKSIMVPGFRKGKAPRTIIEGMYGSKVFYDDAADILAPEAFMFGIKDKDIKAVGRPSMTDIDYAEDKTVTMTFLTAVYPEVTLGQYKGLEAEKAEVVVSDADVDAEVESVRKRNGRTETVERPAAEGDTVVIDFEGFHNGKAFEGGKASGMEIVLGSKQFIDGFEEQIAGMSAGDEKEINVTFPKDYHEASLAGEDAMFKIRLYSVKETQLPDLDDEFAKDVSEFDTLAEYRESVRKNIEERRISSENESFKEALIQKAVDNMTVEVPDAMVDEKLEMMLDDYSRNLQMQGLTLESYLQMMGMDIDTFRSASRTPALNQVKMDLLLNKIAETEAFEISDEEIDGEYDRLSKQYGADIDTVKKAIDRDTVAGDLRIRRASDVIFESGVAVAPKAAEDKPAAKKPAAKKTAKKAEDGGEKESEAPAKKPAAKKPAAKKTAKKVEDGEKEAE